MLLGKASERNKIKDKFKLDKSSINARSIM